MLKRVNESPANPQLFQIHSPIIDSIEVKYLGDVRQTKFYKYTQSDIDLFMDHLWITLVRKIGLY